MKSETFKKEKRKDKIAEERTTGNTRKNNV